MYPGFAKIVSKLYPQRKSKHLNLNIKQYVFKEENVNVGSTVLTEGVTQHPDSGTNKIKSPADLGRCKPKI